jgi:hypothetical protein
MTVEIITKQDLLELRSDLLTEIQKLFEPAKKSEWLKTKEVTNLLKCTPATLQNIRVRGKLPCTKIAGTNYYKRSDVEELLNNSSR